MTVQVGIVGDPVGHSLSPKMHNAAFRELGLDWHYRAIHVLAGEFERKVRALIDGGYAGVNVTIPHKIRALQLADHLTDAARAIGAVNTLTFRSSRVFAANTDAIGFLEALTAAGISDFDNKTALVVGAGGAGRAAAWSLLSRGIRQLYLWNRTAARAGSLARELEPSATGGSKLTVVSDPRGCVKECDLLVNTTSVGLDATDAGEHQLRELHIRPAELHAEQVVADFVYRKGGRTGLIESAARSGATCIDGLELLVRQGAKSFEIWTGVAAPLDAMRLAILQRED